MPAGQHLLVPDGCVDVLWMRRAGGTQRLGALWVCGPETTAWTFSLPPGSSAVGVRFRPGMASAVLDINVSTTTNRRVQLDAFVGVERSAGLAGRVALQNSVVDRVRVVEAFVSDCVATRSERADVGNAEQFVQSVLDHLNAPRTTQAALADRLQMSTRQLHRRSLHSFGYGIATLVRLLRFQRFLALFDANPTSSLASLATTAGFTDQAHLSRECRAITGMSPTKFFTRWFPTFPDMSDPYKTTAPFAANMVA